MSDKEKIGVDQDLGNQVSRILADAAAETHNNRQDLFGFPVEIIPEFSGLRVVDLKNGGYFSAFADGVGSKVRVAQLTNNHKTIAHDLFAMVLDDCVAKGLEPTNIATILDVDKVEIDSAEQVKELAFGYVRAAELGRVAILNGEFAVLGKLIAGDSQGSGFNYNWGAVALGVGTRDKIADASGQYLRPEQKIVALKERGFRSNGFTAAIGVLESEYGENWHSVKFYENSNVTLGSRLLVPSSIYSPMLVDAAGYGVDKRDPKIGKIFGAANITGGGIPEKLGRLLKLNGLGAELYDLYEPVDLMKHVQEVGDIKDQDAYRQWNMGQGMLLIPEDATKFVEFAHNRDFEAKVVGEIIDEPEIRISSRGLTQDKQLVYPI